MCWIQRHTLGKFKWNPFAECLSTILMSLSDCGLIHPYSHIIFNHLYRWLNGLLPSVFFLPSPLLFKLLSFFLLISFPWHETKQEAPKLAPGRSPRGPWEITEADGVIFHSCWQWMGHMSLIGGGPFALQIPNPDASLEKLSLHVSFVWISNSPSQFPPVPVGEIQEN